MLAARLAKYAAARNLHYGWVMAALSFFYVLFSSSAVGIPSVLMFASHAGRGDGPPRHRHPKADEVFVVLDGRLRFWRAGETSERPAGGIFHIPAGIEHTFIVLERARWIALLSPGGLESFFPTAAAQGLEIPRDIEKIKALATQFDMEITGARLTL